MTIITFLIILAVLIFSHELGHFLVAKKLGMRVDEFALGFPPRLFRWRRGETTYALNLVPFGGYVKIFGENYDENGGSGLPGQGDGRRFTARPKHHQAAVLLAGVAFNWLLAWLLIASAFTFGLPISTSVAGQSLHLTNERLVIIEALKDSPAANAGLIPGDQIVYLQVGEEILRRPDIPAVQNFINRHGDRDLVVGYRRLGKLTNQPANQPVETVTIRPITGLVDRRAAIGISMDLVGLAKFNPVEALGRSFIFTGKLTWLTTTALWHFVAQAFTNGGAALEQVTGPIGLVGLVGEARSLGLVYLLTFTALISINLAVINLMPFPALDGGRLLFLVIEKIKGSAIKPKVANTLNALGFALLLLLMLVITYKDIVRIFG